jgi:hypothetical protein
MYQLVNVFKFIQIDKSKITLFIGRLSWSADKLHAHP